MKIIKETVGGEREGLSREDLELIGVLARRPLTAQEVYTFSVRLCDNEIDRDFERFATRTLEELAPMFVGKSGIFDHQWSARGQAARIYKTEVIREPDRLTKTGEGYCWLKGYAYMVRTDSSRDLIAEIEGGIKKEVSVGCSVERAICSVCGCDRTEADCGHEKGREYGGQLCYATLEGAGDAYEFSFVAVPAHGRSCQVHPMGASGGAAPGGGGRPGQKISGRTAGGGGTHGPAVRSAAGWPGDEVLGGQAVPSGAGGAAEVLCPESAGEASPGDSAEL